MEYFLMRKDEVITLCDFSDDGHMITYSENFRNPEIAPLEMKVSRNYLKKWWQNRSIPIRQGRVEEMLKSRDLISPDAYLLANLGLSLTDYYWIKPVDASLKWRDVNLYDNDFKENILTVNGSKSGDGTQSLSPNSSLRGELEKSWMIKRGKRVLVKGNHGDKSLESINEVFAGDVHKAQGYDNYTKYKLVRIKEKSYDYGCSSEAFTNQDVELISAYAVMSSEERPAGKTKLEHLIDVSEKHGIDRNLLRSDLEYQILTDYVLTNIDRHMENVGILRDAKTLKFIRMAPIFDTGRAFAAGYVTPYTDYEIDNIEVNSFEDNEAALLALVTDRSRIDIGKLPSSEHIHELYSKDSKLREEQINSMIRLYEKKIERLQMQ